MIPYIGDFAEDATVYHYFNTFDSNDPAGSVTITNLADTDIYVYKDGSVTDIVTDGASVVIDFDSRTGVHKITVDTSVHADYSIGSDYMVLIEGTTIDAGSVTAGLFTFSIENRFNAAADDLANGTDGLGAIKADTAAILLDTDELQSDDVPGLIATLDAVVDTVKVDTADILVDTGTTLPATLAGLNDFNPAATRVLLDKTDAMIITSAVNDASASTTAFVTDLTEATDDHYIGRTIIFTSGALIGQATDITDYAGSTKTVTVTALTEAPADNDTYEIV